MQQQSLQSVAACTHSHWIPAAAGGGEEMEEREETHSEKAIFHFRTRILLSAVTHMILSPNISIRGIISMIIKFLPLLSSLTSHPFCIRVISDDGKTTKRQMLHSLLPDSSDSAVGPGRRPIPGTGSIVS
jgi:hypothetical protein